MGLEVSKKEFEKCLNHFEVSRPEMFGTGSTLNFNIYDSSDRLVKGVIHGYSEKYRVFDNWATYVKDELRKPIAKETKRMLDGKIREYQLSEPWGDKDKIVVVDRPQDVFDIYVDNDESTFQHEDSFESLLDTLGYKLEDWNES